MILRDHSHIAPDDTGICAHCGQPLPQGHGHVHGYGDKRANWTGVGITVLLHLLLLLVFLLRPHVKKPPVQPEGGSIAYIAPPATKPKRQEAAKSAPKPVKQRKPEVVKMTRLPNTITLPNEKPVEAPPPEPPKMAKVEPEQDMAAMIEARRRARGQAEQPAEESEAERGNRIARENIAAANGRGYGKSESVFDVTNMTFNSANVKLNTQYLNSNRPKLKIETAELGDAVDMETAVVKKMVQMLLSENIVNILFDSRRLGRKVPLSTRPEYRAELESFLMREFFPNYRPPRR